MVSQPRIQLRRSVTFLALRVRGVWLLQRAWHSSRSKHISRADAPGVAARAADDKRHARVAEPSVPGRDSAGRPSSPMTCSQPPRHFAATTVAAAADPRCGCVGKRFPFQMAVCYRPLHATNASRSAVIWFLDIRAGRVRVRPHR